MTGTAQTPIRTTLRLPFDVDLRLTLRPLWHGPGDASIRFEANGFVRALRTSSGPAAVRVSDAGGHEFGVEAWGSGAGEAITQLPALLGADDQLDRFVVHDRLIADLARRQRGLRMTRTAAVFDALLPSIIGQKVTGSEASNSYWSVQRRYGEPAPGPLRLLLPPEAGILAAQPYWRFHRLGLEQRRADVIRRAASVAARLETASVADNGSDELRRRLVSLPGIGPWTAAETIRVALGDPDAVSVGDYHIPSLVSWALAGEPRGSDARMLELLEPYAGQRARVVLLLETSGIRPPRYGPRMAARSIAAI